MHDRSGVNLGDPQQDSMMESNQALSWMVFVRDRDRFEKLFPGLVIEEFAFTPWLAYLISGGVTMRDLIPRFLVYRFIETGTYG